MSSLPWAMMTRFFASLYSLSSLDSVFSGIRTVRPDGFRQNQMPTALGIVVAGVVAGVAAGVAAVAVAAAVVLGAEAAGAVVA